MPANIASVLRQKGHHVWSLPPTASVYEAIQIMAEKHIGALMVVSGDQLVGIVSERDYARKVILQGRSSTEAQVSEIMTSPVVWVTPEHTVADCMRIMTEKRVRHLPVLDGAAMVGVVSIGDLVKSIITEQVETIHYLETYITGRYAQ